MRAAEYLDQIPMWTRKKNSLADVKTCLRWLGSPERDLKIIHVAGTNGKGSVCAFLTGIFSQAGYRTGTFISPHLERIEERFLIGGNPVGEEAFQDSFERVLAMTEAVMTQGLCHPTFFEFLFYMAMVLFQREKAELVILETGMGGRLDTTNAVENPLVCAITSISLEHTQYLGDTVQAIAGEKAGIIKPMTPVVLDGADETARTVICGRAREQKAPWISVEDGDYQILEEETEPGLTASGFWMETLWEGEPLKLWIPFEAEYQAANAVIAVKVAGLLTGQGFTLSLKQLRAGIARTRWPGRMEEAAPGIFLDGAHNPAGLAAFLQAAGHIVKKRQKKAFLLFSVVSDKDYVEMIGELAQGIDWQEIGVAHLNSGRAMDNTSLAEQFRSLVSCPVHSYETAAQGLLDMKRRAGDQLLFCAGSLYLVGELKETLRRLRNKERDE